MRLRLPRIEVGKIEPRRIAHEKMQPVELLLAAGGFFCRPIVIGGDLKPRARRQDLHRLAEVDVLVPLDEADDVARNAAAETVIVPVPRIDGKGGRLFVMEGAARPIGVAPSLELDIGADDFDDVVLRFELLHELGRIDVLQIMPSFIRSPRAARTAA